MDEYLLLQITPAPLPALVLADMRVNVYMPIWYASPGTCCGALHVQYREMRAPKGSYSAGIDAACTHRSMCSVDNPGRTRRKWRTRAYHDKITTRLKLTCCPSLPKQHRQHRQTQKSPIRAPLKALWLHPRSGPRTVRANHRCPSR